MMKTFVINTILVIAVVIHLGMLWNLAHHFEWQPGFPPTWLPRKTGIITATDNNKTKHFFLFKDRYDPRFEAPWQKFKKAHVRSKQLMSVPQRQTDNFGLDLLLRDANNTDPGGDFFQLVRSGIDLRQGTSIYQNYPPDMDPRIKKYLEDSTPFHPPNRYPPGFAYSFGYLLSLLKPWDAYLVWILLHEITLIVCIVKSRKLSEGSTARFKIAAAMWLGFLPWYLELYMGQTTFILMAATFILAAHLDDRAGSVHAGVWWTLSLITKPITLLYSPVLLVKRRLGILVTGLAVSIGSAMMYFNTRPDDGRLFLKWMSGEEMVISLGNYCFQALLFRFHVSENLPIFIAGAFILIGLFMTFIHSSAHPTRLISIWICVYFLSYTHVWQHHLVLFLPALILLWLYSAKYRYVLIWVLAALPSTYFIFDSQWNWTREVIYLSGASLPVLILFVDQVFFKTRRALHGE